MCTEWKAGHSHVQLARRDDSVMGDELSHDAAGGFDTKRERTDIDEGDVTKVLATGKYTTLDSGTVHDGRVVVDTFRGLAPEVFLQELLYLRDTGRTTTRTAHRK